MRRVVSQSPTLDCRSQGRAFRLAILALCVLVPSFRALADEDAKARALALIEESGIRLIRGDDGEYRGARLPAGMARNAERPDLAIRAINTLESVREVDANGRRVTKGMLEALLSLEFVRVLDLGGARFEDQDGLRPKAKSLEKLDLAESNANDALLMALRTVSSLRELNLSKTLISGDGMGALRGMKNLQSLNLSWTNTMPEAAQELEELTSLVRCDLSHTRFTLQAVKSLLPLKRLEYLNLDRTEVEDVSLKELDKLTELRELSLETPFVSYRGLAHIKSLKNLRTLRGYRFSGDYNRGLFELKKRIPTVQIADLVLYGSGVSRRRDATGDVTSLTIRSRRYVPDVNALIDAGELTKLTAIEFSGSELNHEGLDDLTLPKSLTHVDAHQVVAISPKLITRIAALPKLESFSVWGDSLTDESRNELEKLADRIEVNLVGRGGTTRLRAE